MFRIRSPQPEPVHPPEPPAPKVEYFDVTCREAVRHALAVLKLAGEDWTPRNVAAVVASAPRTLDDVGRREHRRASYCRQCLILAVERLTRQSTEAEKEAFEEAQVHFLEIFPKLGDPTRRLLEEAVFGLAAPLMHPDSAGPVREESRA